MPENDATPCITATESGKSLWELLWDYDPNGLLVVDEGMIIRLVNPALCQMLRTRSADIVGRNAEEILGDVSDFRAVWENDTVIRAAEKEYPQFGLYVREVIFPIRDQGIVACIMVDLTHEWERKNDLLRLKRETLENVNRVVDNQMKTAQEIAGLLGEATAETKVSLLKVIDMLNEETA